MKYRNWMDESVALHYANTIVVCQQLPQHPLSQYLNNIHDPHKEKKNRQNINIQSSPKGRMMTYSKKFVRDDYSRRQ